MEASGSGGWGGLPFILLLLPFWAPGFAHSHFTRPFPSKALPSLYMYMHMSMCTCTHVCTHMRSVVIFPG